MNVRRNVIANLVGSAWTGFIALAFIPIYLHTMGAESYGLVGFFVVLVSLMSVFDGGFGAATSRELARAVAGGAAGAVRDLVRTLEWIFWAIAAVLGSVVALAASFFTTHWLKFEALSNDQALLAFRLMGLTLALQWPVAYYTGCVIGLQRQVGLNFINAGSTTLRFGGAAAVVSFLSPTITAFFAWQAVAILLQVIVLRQYLWRAMPGSGKPVFSMKALHEVKVFALGVAGVNVLALILTQVDKIVLSKILPLDQLGYYTIAATLAAILSRIVMPIFNASYPKLAQLVALGVEHRAELVAFYRKACEMMAFAIVPLAMVLVVFAKETVFIWTGDIELAERLRPVVACLAAGTLFNGMMTIPYALQLAEGWTSLAFWQNVIAVLILVPAIWLLAARFGLVGAASVWLVVNASYVVICAPIMYTRLLREEMRDWYLHAILLPVAIAILVLLPFRWLANDLQETSRTFRFWLVAIAGITAQLSLAMLLRGPRTVLAKWGSRSDRTTVSG